MKTEDLIKYALIAVGAYLVWEYVISPMMAAPAIGTGATPPVNTNTGVQPVQNTQTQIQTQPVQTQPALPPTQPTGIASNPDVFSKFLNAAAGGNANSQMSLNLDQWAYYYNGLNSPVVPLTGDQIATMMNAGGITATNRSTLTMSAGQFVDLLQAAGITGSGMSGMSGVGQTAKTNLRGGFSSRRPNAFGGSGGGSGRRLQTVH